MSTLTGRDNTALLVVDLQNGVVGEAYQRDRVVATIATLIGKARDAGVDVVWIQHTTEDLTSFGAPPPEQVIVHTNLYWRHHQAPGRTAGTVDAADVVF